MINRCPKAGKPFATCKMLWRKEILYFLRPPPVAVSSLEDGQPGRALTGTGLTSRNSREGRDEPDDGEFAAGNPCGVIRRLAGERAGGVPAACHLCVTLAKRRPRCILCAAPDE
jgi:hypothetical protein